MPMTATMVAEVFDKVFQGQHNPMTPTVIRYGTAGDYLYELSRGPGMNQTGVYGVTVVCAQTGTECTDKSRVLFSITDAEQYIRHIRNPKLNPLPEDMV